MNTRPLALLLFAALPACSTVTTAEMAGPYEMTLHTETIIPDETPTITIEAVDPTTIGFDPGIGCRLLCAMELGERGATGTIASGCYSVPTDSTWLVDGRCTWYAHGSFDFIVSGTVSTGPETDPATYPVTLYGDGRPAP